MKNLITIYKYIFFITIFIALLFAFNVIPLWKVKSMESDKFSAMRVARDLEVISKEHHSIEHPLQRAAVRDYLYDRLNELGGEAKMYPYDSISCKFGGVFDIENVYACFNPDTVTANTKYVLLVAHLDSRFHNIVRGDTVYSYGAADDGYGLGVILETINIALHYKNNWKQGIKVLFTDSEEHELDGIYNAVNFNQEIFNNVNFVINIEARGVKGDALLFETSANNEAVMDLYKCAKFKRGFSLTTLVYNVLPNDTDFTHLKNTIPGLNFAVIDNLDYYHTDKDCFSNISLNSIQHYGEQISPIIKKYLTSKEYTNINVLKSSDDSIFFAFPLLGMFIFSPSSYFLLNMLTYILFLFALFKLYISFRVRVKDVLSVIGKIFLYAFFSLLIGTLIAFILSLIFGLKFDFVSLKYVPYSGIITLVLFALYIFIIWQRVIFRNKKSIYFYINILSASLICLFILSVSLYIFIKENFFVLLPLLVTSLAIIFSFNLSRRLIILTSVFITILISAYFIFQLYLAITIGSIGALLFLSTFIIFTVIAQYSYYNYCYNRKFI